MKVLTVIGARPQFIKAATVSRQFRNRTGVTEILVHTGQHYDSNMSEVFFEELEIPEPDYNLGIQSGTHGVQTGRMLESIENVMLSEKPEWVLVYGDTNSTLAGTLAAAKLHIPVAHVEAGLRSFNRKMPEEVNRVLTDHVAELLFTPSKLAGKNLVREGISPEKIRFVGDVMYDAALFYGLKSEKNYQLLDSLGLERGEYVLATIHRAENTDDSQRLTAILEALIRIAATEAVVLPLHPRTRKALEANKLFEYAKQGLQLIDPVGYLDMIVLEKHARVIATDSGGVQKEAFFYRVPCVTLRDETEWVELVELGWNRVVPPVSVDTIFTAIINASKGQEVDGGPYGEGLSASSICSSLLEL